ncbi:ak1 [Symbiodinium sp. CCMP2456]|nr:ak1 [Symbiodinium sp. CCMP2456]
MIDWSGVLSGAPAPAPSPPAAAKAKAQAKAKAKAKVKAKAKANPTISAELLRARVDKCQWCGQKRHGWCDNSLLFYCETCWGSYDALEVDGEEYAGKEWHDAILEADNLAAGNDDVDSGEMMEAMKDCLKEIDATRYHPEEDAAESEEDEDDEVADLDQAFRKEARVEAPELQQAHVIVIVDTSGSMRTVDVKPDRGSEWVSRMAAVRVTLAAFFEKQVQAASPHRFSLISFSEISHMHFCAKTADRATMLVNSSLSFAASHGTHFVAALESAKTALSKAAGTPHLLIFSDGRPADGAKTLALVQDMLKEHTSLRIHAIGFGDGLEFEMLQQLTSIGRGTFAPSGRSVAALHGAFASVTSTITLQQTVTSRTSKSSTFSFQGGHGPGQASRDEAQHKAKEKSLNQRQVTFEYAHKFVWDDKSLNFPCSRRGLNFNGKGFREYLHRPASLFAPVYIRLQPFTEGGMRHVYCFKDSSVHLWAEQGRDEVAMQAAGTDARMVAKLSRYSDEWHNSFDVVSSYAKSSAIAKWFSRIFMLAAADRLGLKGRSMARIIFVECYIYEARDGYDAPTKFFVGERYLPGSFLKYNSNHGYVNPEAPDTEIAQAFSHFTFEASGGKHMVLDLQGVYVDKEHRRRPHIIMTDPQVVSLEKAFGPGDLGVEGMRAFFHSHKCGPTCRQMRLDPYTLKRLRRIIRRKKVGCTGPEQDGDVSSAPAPVGEVAPPALMPPTPSESGSIMSLRAPEAVAPLQPEATPGSEAPASSALTTYVPSQPKADMASEGQLLSRHSSAVGSKAGGPLSAVMARSPAVTERPSFESWLQSQSTQQDSLRASAPPFRPASAPEPLTSQSMATPPATTILAAQPSTPPGEVGLSLADSGASRASTSSLRSEEGGSSDSTADRPPSPQQEARKTVIYGPGGQKLSTNCASREDVAKAIVAQWSIPEEEQLLFQESSSQTGTDFFRVERKMDPRKLRFTQASISPTFRDGRQIFQLMNDLNSQEVDPLRELEPLDVVWHNGYWRSLSNRRLWTLKHCTAAMTDQALFVRVRVRAPDAEFRTKLTSTNDGVSVLIMNRARSPSPTAAR